VGNRAVGRVMHVKIKVAESELHVAFGQHDDFWDGNGSAAALALFGWECDPGRGERVVQQEGELLDRP
jgi:hypothetical protein